MGLLKSTALLLVMSAPAHADFQKILDPSAMDTKVDACDDFYKYSCGGWLSKTEIPADASLWGRGFSTIREENLSVLKKILEDASKQKPSNTLGEFYSKCMDEKGLDRSQKTVLGQFRRQIDSVDSKNLTQNIALLQNAGVGVLFSFASDIDPKNSQRYLGAFDQGGISLPNKDYYLSDDKEKVEIRKKFLLHVAKILTLTGKSPKDAKRDAEFILNFETELAKISLAPDERRDPEKLYFPMTVAELQTLSPHIQWAEFLKTLEIANDEPQNVMVPTFFKGLNPLLEKTPLAELKTYLNWHLIRDAANRLGKKLRDESFQFNGKTLYGQKKEQVRWKLCVQSADHFLKDILSEAFVQKVFDEESKKKTIAILANIQESFASNLKTMTWIDAETQKLAIEKLNALHPKIGYPDKWRDLSGIKINPKNSHYENIKAATIFWSKRDLHKIGKPVDRNEWGMTPPTVNAYYSPSENEIVFPAGILQPPFFHRDAPVYANYGAYGMVIGHELTHGYDDQGRKYDAVGNMKNWWSEAAIAAFNEKAECLVHQYSQYEPVKGAHINGKLTLGENIADLGGLRLSYAAFQLDQKKQETQSRIPGATVEQQFFIAFAQSWCTKATEETKRARLSNDPHSPPEFRVNGVVSNMTEFAKAFSCKEGKPMAPVKRCAVW